MTDRRGQDILKEIRRAVADYMWSEGCSCCQNYDDHKEHRKRLGKLLKVPKHKDCDFYDFTKYRTKAKS